MKVRRRKTILTVEDSLARWIRKESVRLEISVSQFVEAILKSRKQESDRYQIAMKRSLARKSFLNSSAHQLLESSAKRLATALADMDEEEIATEFNLARLRGKRAGRRHPPHETPHFRR